MQEQRNKKKQKNIHHRKNTHNLSLVVIITHNVFKTNGKFHRKQGKKTLRQYHINLILKN